jgi:hypothetical protein
VICFNESDPLDFFVTQMQSSIPTTKFFCQLGIIVDFALVF